MVAVIVLALLGAAMVLAQPRWAFVMVLLMFPLKQLLQAYIPVLRGGNQWAPNVAIALLAGFALALRLFRRANLVKPYLNAGTFCVAGLYAMAGVGLLYTPAFDNAALLWKDGLPYQVLLLVILPMLADDTEDLRRMMVGLMVAGTAIALLIIFNPAAGEFGGRIMLDVDVQRTSAGRGGGNPLAIADFGGAVAVVGALTLQRRGGAFSKGLRAAAVLLGMGLAVWSGSRGQMIATVLVCVAFYPLARPFRNLKQGVLLVLGLLVLTGILYVTIKLFLTEAAAQRWVGRQWTQGMGGRIEAILILLRAWAESPLAWVVGLGTNAYHSLTGALYVHNVAVEALAELGIIGFLLFMGAAVATARSGLALWRKHHEDPERRAAVAALLGLAAFSTLTALKQGCIITFPAPFYWWLVVTYVAKREALQEREAAAWASLDEAPPPEPYGPDEAGDATVESAGRAA